MVNKNENLITHRVAAKIYGLPSKWLREQAELGNIPAIIAQNSILFDSFILAEWLSKKAKEGGFSGK